jgi:hypothetical protein
LRAQYWRRKREKRLEKKRTRDGDPTNPNNGLGFGDWLAALVSNPTRVVRAMYPGPAAPPSILDLPEAAAEVHGAGDGGAAPRAREVKRRATVAGGDGDGARRWGWSLWGRASASSSADSISQRDASKHVRRRWTSQAL